MEQEKSTDRKPRLRRSIILCAIFVGASALGMFLARPIALQFRMSSPWVLPAIAVGILTVLVVVALLVLPHLTARRP